MYGEEQGMWVGLLVNRDYRMYCFPQSMHTKSVLPVFLPVKPAKAPILPASSAPLNNFLNRCLVVVAKSLHRNLRKRS